MEAGFTITNAHTPNLINITVKKVWEDNNNYYGARTPIEVTLNANGEESQTVTITEADNWQHTFERVPEYENGEKVNYTITEKAVESYQTTITGSTETGFTITNKYNNVTVNKKTLVDSETTQREVGLDVVFVLDISGSMRKDSIEGFPKLIPMVDATNEAITEIMKDRNNRVGIVLFSTEATTLLPLNRYTPESTVNGVGQYLEEEITGTDISDSLYYINTNVREEYKTRVEVIGETCIQLGLSTGANLLLNETNTEKRQPVMILLTDGYPSYSTVDYSNVKASDISNGYDTGAQGYLTILSANYYKNEVSKHYSDAEALMYTIGLGNLGTYGEVLLNPIEENVNKCLGSEVQYEIDLYNYLTGAETKIEDLMTGKVTEVLNPYEDYSYAKGSFVEEMTSEELSDVFSGIIEEINKVYKTTTVETSNINMDVSKIELENLDTNENITIIIDGQEREYTVDELLALSTVIQENGKYYLDLKSTMFSNAYVVDITYYEVSESNRKKLTGYSLLSQMPLLEKIRESVEK